MPVSAPAFRAGMAKCQQDLPGPPTPTASQLVKIRALMVIWAKCMRGHGLPQFGDPTITANGDRIMRGQFNIGSPAYYAARQACDPALTRVVFVFGNGWVTSHLGGATRPLFRGPTERRWWHVELGDPGSKWVLDVRLDQIERVRFIRTANPFPSFPGQESLVVHFESSDGEQTALHCYLQDLYEGARLRPDRLRTWEDLRT